MKKLEQLLDAYPLLYRGFRGFECYDGWYDLLDELSATLEAHLLAHHPDWVAGGEPVVLQVKEKFAGLRFYMAQYDEVIDTAIRQAEARSIETCERCGLPGQLIESGWYRIRCEGCYLMEQEQQR